MKMGYSRFISYLPKVENFADGCARKITGSMYRRGLFLPLLEISQCFSDFHDPLAASRMALHRPLHELERTEFHVEGVDDMLGCSRRAIHADAEKVCRILSKEINSNINSLLDQSGVQVSADFVVEVLKKLSNAGTLALSFFRWVEKQQGFKHSTECYHHLIDALGKIKQFKMIWSLVDVMKDQQLLTKETFALISRRYARAKKTSEAIGTFHKMRNFGLKPNISDFNQLLDTLSKSKNVKVAYDIFHDMRQGKQFSPDLKTYTILLEGWGSMLNRVKLTEVYQELMDNGFLPDIVTYGVLIHGFVKCRKLDEAIKIFHEMLARNLKPSPHIFCTLINGLGSEKQLHEALKYFELSKASEFSLDIPMYNAVVGAYCWVQQFDNAYRILAEMKNSGLSPNARTYEVILHHLIKARRTEEAYLLFQGMTGDSEPELNTYTMIVRMFCTEEKVDMALTVWYQMSEKGVIPCLHMYSVLINGLLHEHRLEEACEYFQEMLGRGLRPPALLYDNLKQALLVGGKMDLAMHLGAKLDALRRTRLTG